LCDVDDATGTIDVACAEALISPRTKAIIPVHLYGQPADMDGIGRLASRHGIAVIEDVAQAVGARWNGHALGTLGRIGCMSFYPGKNLGAAGEGGALVTDDAPIADRLCALRNHGQRERYLHAEIGFNYRMDGLQGAVLCNKLARLDQWTKRRRMLADMYREGLAGLPLEAPAIRNQDHVWHLFVIRTPRRDALRSHLQDHGIESGLHYPVPLHRQPCLAYLCTDGRAFPNSDRWASEGLSLPLYYGMTDAQLEYVVTTVRDFFRHA
jgi:dTDP-4-amino-4,6-dideoxygalactose transaminase